VGLVRAITVKVNSLCLCSRRISRTFQERSSAKRKQMFKDIQQRDGVELPKQLLLDMPVQWSSTYVMLDRAEKLRKVPVMCIATDNSIH
jgi:hypothetical protein